MKFNALMIEDDLELIKMFRKIESKDEFSEIIEFDNRKTTESAKNALAARPVHLASVDQNLPQVEGEVAAAEHGFDLLEEIVRTRPMVRTVMYTAYGAIPFANRAGRLGSTEYLEKKTGSDQPGSLDAIDYFRLVKCYLQGGMRPDNEAKEKGYIHWALGQGREHLPGMIGLPSGQLHDAQTDVFDSEKASKSLSGLIERTVQLAWAQACALYLRVAGGPERPWEVPRDTFGFISQLSKIWTELEELGELGRWNGYLSQSTPNGWGPAGDKFVASVNKLRVLRNAEAHGRIRELTPIDLDEHAAALLGLLDGLAYWADHPLMYGVRIHPDDRRKLQFQKIVGATAWPEGTINSDVSLIAEANRRTSIQVLHQNGDYDRLIDLAPFISMVEQRGKPPTPTLLVPSPKGVMRRSLSSGAEIQAPIPIGASDRSDLETLFGTSLRF